MSCPLLLKTSQFSSWPAHSSDSLVTSGTADQYQPLLHKKLWVPTNYLYEVDKHRSEKTASEEKYGLKDLQSNPWKLSTK